MLVSIAEFLLRLLAETLPFLIATLSGNRLIRSEGPNRPLYAIVLAFALLSGLSLSFPLPVPKEIGLAGGVASLPLWLFVRLAGRSQSGRYRLDPPEFVFRTSRRPLLLTRRLRRDARPG